METGRRRSKLGWALGLLAIAGVAGIAGFGVLLSTWSELVHVTPAEAQAAAETLLEGPAAGPAYLRVSPEGEVSVRRELEREDPTPLRTLVVWACRADSHSA